MENENQTQINYKMQVNYDFKFPRKRIKKDVEDLYIRLGTRCNNEDFYTAFIAEYTQDYQDIVNMFIQKGISENELEKYASQRLFGVFNHAKGELRRHKKAQPHRAEIKNCKTVEELKTYYNSSSHQERRDAAYALRDKRFKTQTQYALAVLTRLAKDEMSCVRRQAKKSLYKINERLNAKKRKLDSSK